MIRRTLKRLAPTWVASPLRRSIQTACFLAFLGLFFYVCCPYPTRPAGVWDNWLPQDANLQTGRVGAVTDGAGDESLAAGRVVHVLDRGVDPAEYLGPFRIAEAGDRQLLLDPRDPLTPEQLDKLGTSFGPWSLSDDPPGAWPSHYARGLAAKERVAAELFLLLDPLVSVSTAIAGRTWVWSLGAAAVAIAVCLVVPRGFCAYVCPMGTLLDLFDWLLRPWRRRFVRSGRSPGGTDCSPGGTGRLSARGENAQPWWAWLKYLLLLAVLAAAMFGVLISGFVAAIPVATRALAFLAAPLQTAAFRGWYQVPPFGPGHFVSLGLLAAIVALGLLRPRFWCRYLCPTGAVFSTAGLLRLTQRKVQPGCIACGRCVEICPFDAIAADFSTRPTECTLCRTCGGVCPTKAIRYVPRWSQIEDRPTDEADVRSRARRRFLAGTLGTAAGIGAGIAAAGLTRTLGAGFAVADAFRPVRPPGSVPEPQFLATCIRCGECYRACPNDVLQPLSFEQGLEGLWTPQVVADWSGCEPSCNNCGRVCPTGAIRALALEEKSAARMALAVVDQSTCLPYAGVEACQLCVDECVTAGYHAIEFMQVGTEVDRSGRPIEGTGYLAPVVLAEKCVGCGLCQTRCRAINAVEKGLIAESAIRLQAGSGKEDRLVTGSYRALRRREERRPKPDPTGVKAGEGYLPEFLK